ncbi:sulfatase [Bacteroides ovatus]|nr:sulfatase-like hydrolase/transferase [Bacteroides ovatus]
MNKLYSEMKCSSISKVCLSSLCALPFLGFAQKRPHIILIFTDQQNVNAMSAAGNPFLYTPNMDALADDGIRFTNAYCTSPVSGPSRASIVTGLMAREAGVEWNDNSRLGKGIQTVGDLLGENGYRTVWAGKWHIPEIYPQRSKEGVKYLHGFELLPFWDAPDRRWLLGAETDPPLTDAVVSFLDGYDRREKPLFLAVSYHNPHDICMYPRKIGWETMSDSLLNLRPFGKYKLPEPMGIHPDSLSCLPPLPGNFSKDISEPEFIMDKRVKPNPYGDEVQLSSEFSEREW